MVSKCKVNVGKRRTFPHHHQLHEHKYKFSRDEEQNLRLPFLDTLVQRQGDDKLCTSVYLKSSASDVNLHYSSDQPTNHKCLSVKILLDRTRLYCSDKTTLTVKRPYFPNMFRNCGHPLSFIRHLKHHKILRARRQQENSTPEAPSDDQGAT